jgi:hypothetical protein
MLVIEGTNPIELQKIKDTNTMEPLWASEKNLYNASGEMIGKINKDKGVMKVFVVGA